MSFSSGMVTAAEQPVVLPFYAIKISLPATLALPAKTLCLLDGSGTLSFGGDTYLGSDGDYGSWGGMEAISEQIGGQATRFKTSFMGLSDTAVQQLCQPQSQLAPVVVSYGMVDLASGAPVSTPYNYFNGLLDVGHVSVGQNSKSVDLEIVDYFELMFATNAGATLSSAWHNLFFASETGFEFVDNVTHQIPWGQKGPRPDQVSNVDNYDVGPGLPSYTLKF